MKMRSKILAIILSVSMLLGLTACGKSTDPSCHIDAVTYEGINTISNVDQYASEVSINGGNNHNPVENGVIISPYWTLKVNGKETTVYASRSANGIHSYVWLDVIDTEEKGFNITLELSGTENATVFKPKKAACVVLPESHGVTAELNRDDKTVKATVTAFGSYSFTFNESHEQPLTVMVTEQQDVDAIFGDYTVKNISVGDYSTASKRSKTIFTEENTVYYFGAGRYKIQEISLPSNSVLYLEPGAYLDVISSRETKNNGTQFIREKAINITEKENVTIAGRGLLDFSSCTGSSIENWNTNDKDTLIINNSKNVSVSGVSVINSQHWTLCFYSTENIHVKNVFFMAYRMYADGVMLSNCKDAVVENSFARTGDDAFETKSQPSTSPVRADNILFQNNDAWTDKALAYGCVFESSFDTHNVTFKNCSVGFALGYWSEHLGCCIVQLGQSKYPDTVDENIVFENIEIYSSKNQAILQCYVGGNPSKPETGAGTIRNVYFKNITAKFNMGKVLNVQTDDPATCFIEDIYLDNITSNGVAITASNIAENMRDKVIGGYDMSKLHVNTRG